LKFKPCILGVAGGTGSGKTTVARAILEAVGAERITFIEQDSYYRDVDWRSEAELLHHNFDHPAALDNELLVSHLAALKAGHPIEVPIYDFVRHRRTARTRRVSPQPVILLEGILIFVEANLRELLDFKIYVDTDADLRLIRRLGRDMAERGRTVQDVLRQYLETVRPMHLEFVEPSKRWADVIIPEGGENRVALEMVIAHVQQLLGGK
jgi:uridine kinase